MSASRRLARAVAELRAQATSCCGPQRQLDGAGLTRRTKGAATVPVEQWTVTRRCRRRYRDKPRPCGRSPGNTGAPTLRSQGFTAQTAKPLTLALQPSRPPSPDCQTLKQRTAASSGDRYPVEFPQAGAAAVMTWRCCSIVRCTRRRASASSRRPRRADGPQLLPRPGGAIVASGLNLDSSPSPIPPPIRRSVGTSAGVGLLVGSAPRHHVAALIGPADGLLVGAPAEGAAAARGLTDAGGCGA